MRKDRSDVKKPVMFALMLFRRLFGEKSYDFSTCHGLFYNLGKADRSLVTNEKVKPKNNGDLSYASIS